MVKAETLGKLAREYEAALIKFERTKDTETLKEFLSSTQCEVFEGANDRRRISSRTQTTGAGVDILRGVFPQGPLFITASVDTGGRQFDVAWLAWDLEGRSWLLDRPSFANACMTMASCVTSAPVAMSMTGLCC